MALKQVAALISMQFPRSAATYLLFVVAGSIASLITVLYLKARKEAAKVKPVTEKVGVIAKGTW